MARTLLNFRSTINRVFYRQQSCRGESHGKESLKDLVPKPLDEEVSPKPPKALCRCPDILEDISKFAGLPNELICRPVRIFRPAKNAMQSGTDNTHCWLVEFYTEQRWENALMGWCSGGDTLANIQLKFSSVGDAVNFCRKNGWEYYVTPKSKPKKFKPKSYRDNFVNNLRLRVSTK